MKKPTFRVVITLILSLSISVVFADGQETPQSQKDRKDAERIWEQAIAAKGGRSNLHTIHSLSVTTTSHNSNDERKFQDLQVTEFFLLPDKVWSWIDQRPGFPLTVRQYDFQSEIGYEIDERTSYVERPEKETSIDRRLNSILFDGSRFNDYMKSKFFENQMIYLMETKWFHPDITGMRIEGRGKKKVAIIEAAFGRKKFEYYLDAATNLPKKITITTWFESLKTSDSNDFYLSDYVEINGVKFPQNVSLGSGDESRTTYLVNPPYNKNLFKQQPSLTAGPDAWKAKEPK